MRTTRALLALAATSTLLLSGCGLSDLLGADEPVRDETTGEIVEASDADAFAIRLGDCLDTSATIASDEPSEVESLPTVPCGDPHDSEVYATEDIEGEEFPGDDAAMEAADEFCYGEFEPFVGVAYEESVLDFTTMYPSADSWEYLDDREIVCIVVDPEGGVTGSMKDAQR